jgi:hypothetical protein
MTDIETKLNSEPVIKTLAMQPDDLLCYLCLNKICSASDRFLYQGNSSFEFRNPSGQLFSILTVTRAPGCKPVGSSTTDFTWFEGHAWTVCLCGKCGQQMGWKYTGKTSFFGLIRSRLVSGSSILN